LNTHTVAFHTNRVWRQKITDNIEGSLQTNINNQIKNALKDSKITGFEYDKYIELAHKFIIERTHKRLKTLYNNNITDPDNSMIANAKKNKSKDGRTRPPTHKKNHNPIPLLQSGRR
jgi:hypothetical protein